MVAMTKVDERVIEPVPIKVIIVDPGRRSLNEQGVADLMGSIAEIGVRQPIEITEDHHLITGLHRLEACKRLGLATIPAMVSRLDALHNELIEIDENLVRSELTALERARHLARKKEIYEALHPDARRGATPAVRGEGGRIIGKSQREPKSPENSVFGDAEPVPSFVEHTAKQLGRAKSTVWRDVRIGKNITEAAEQVVKGTPIENRVSDLRGLAEISDPVQQVQAATVLVERAAQRNGSRGKLKDDTTGKQIEAVVPREVVKQVRTLDRVFERLEATDPKVAAKYHPANDREWAAVRMQRMVDWMTAFIAAARPG